MSHFATLLETHTDTLLKRWVEGVGEHHPHASSPARLGHRLPVLLRTLISLLRGSERSDGGTPAIQFGFDVQSVVREYGVLGSVLLDLAAERGTSVSASEVRVFTAFMTSIVADDVAVHGVLRAEAERADALTAQALEIERLQAEARREQLHAARLEVETAAAQRSEGRLRQLLEATVAGTWEFDVATQSVVADAGLLALHHQPAGEPLDLATMMGTVHPDDRSAVSAAITSALDPLGSHHYRTEYRVLGAKGRYRWVEATGRGFFDEAGLPQKIVGTALDISQRKEAELAREGVLEALKAQPLLQVVVLEGPDLVVTMMNAEYRANVAGGRDLVGMPAHKAFPQLASHGYASLLNGVLTSGKPFVGRDVLAPVDRGDGVLEDRYFDFVVQPVRGRFGRVDSLLNISLDVTTTVEARRELEAFVAQEQERAELERQIIGVVSHDLGNPLTILRLGMGQLLRDETLSPNGARLAGRLKNTLDGMNRLVDDLVDFTQARQGTGLSVVRAAMNLHEVVRESVDELRALFPGRELELEHEGAGDGSWDRRRLAQAATNLIGNALKHCVAGLPVRVKSRGHEEHMELEVSNRGEPIPADLLPHLFEPMQSGRAHPPELGPRVGLELFIVKHVVDALGGTIGVTSSAAAGTTFKVSFPR